jgi:hypothetical protein
MPRKKNTDPLHPRSTSRPKTQRRLFTPKIYYIGEDLSQEHYTELLVKLTDWVAVTRKTPEPGIVARNLINACLKGVTPKDGKTPWYSAANATFAMRIKMAARFDMTSPDPADWRGVKTADESVKAKKEALKRRKEVKAAEALEDNLIPDEIRQGLKKQIRYGDNPLVLLSSAEETRWRELYEDFQKTHPHLKVASSQAELELLCSLLVAQSRFQMRLLAGESVDEVKFAKIVDQIPKIKESLDIHPNQINKRKERQKQQTLGDAINRFESMPDWRAVRAKYWTEELLQAFQMYNMPRADGNGYQLDDVGFFGLTRCRSCVCPKCGQRNVAGFSYQEIEDWLLANGHIEALDPVTDHLAQAAAAAATPPVVGEPVEDGDELDGDELGDDDA